jgi:SSS family solute:Na+ symporter
MSGMAGNVTAFNTVWTYDIYQAYIRPDRPDRHYLVVGRLATFVAVGLSVATAYIVLGFNNLMDYVQLLFSFFNAPLFATFLLGMFTYWATPAGGFWGLVAGTAGAFLHYLAYRSGVIPYGSEMSANFYGAICGWSTCFAVTCIVSLFTRRRDRGELAGLVYERNEAAGTGMGPGRRMAVVFAGLVLAALVLLNWIFF